MSSFLDERTSKRDVKGTLRGRLNGINFVLVLLRPEKTSFRRDKNNFRTSSRRLLDVLGPERTSFRRDTNNFRTSSGRLRDAFWTFKAKFDVSIGLILDLKETLKYSKFYLIKAEFNWKFRLIKVHKVQS